MGVRELNCRAMNQTTTADLLRAGMAHHEAGRLAEAEAIYKQVLQREPRNVDGLHLSGLIAHQHGRHAEAIELVRQSVIINAAVPMFWFNFGNVLGAAGKESDGVDAFRTALQLQPDFADACHNLCNYLEHLNRLEESATALQTLVRLRPDSANAHFRLGWALHRLGHYGAAAQAYRRALELQPDMAHAQLNLAGVLQQLGRTDESIESARKAQMRESLDFRFHSNLLLTLHHSDTATAAEVFAEHLRWAQLHADPLTPKNPRLPAAEGRLRVGYVSYDFRNHPVGFFMESILAHHNRERFEITCYSGTARQDEFTARMKAGSERWIEVAPLSDAELAGQIEQDRIDLLIDLAGHTADHRLLAFARRPAAVAATYLGYPGTTGMSAMDYRITDAIADPPGMTEQFYTEKLVRLPDGFLCYRPPDVAGEIAPLAADAMKHITFGSFNHAGKISATTLRLWGAVLRADTDARLVLKALGLMDEQTRDRIRRELRQLGVSADRITFLPVEMDPASHLARYRQVDIALDPYPYHGTTTTCEALWMGVPVITLAGPVHAARVGASILSNIGLPELVAQTPDDFVRIATELGRDRARLRELHESLRGRMRASPLLDGAKFTRNLEAAFERMISATA